MTTKPSSLPALFFRLLVVRPAWALAIVAAAWAVAAVVLLVARCSVQSSPVGPVGARDPGGAGAAEPTAVVAAETPVESDTDVTRDSIEPALVWADGHFAVLWTSARHGARDCPEIYFTTVDAHGRRGVVRRITQSEGPVGNHRPAVVFDGQELGLAWQWSRYGHFTAVRFIRLSKMGEHLGEARALQGPFYNATAPALALTSEGYGVAWASIDVVNELVERYSLQFASFTRRGVPQVRASLAEATRTPERAAIHLAAVGDGYVAVWSYGWTVVEMANVTQDGQVGPAKRLIDFDPRSGDRVHGSALARAGSELAFLWAGVRSRRGGVGFGTFTKAGSWTREPRLFHGPGMSPALASDGPRLHAAWYDTGNHPDAVRLRLGQLTEEGDLARPVTAIGDRADRAGGCAVAVGGGQVAVAWTRREALHDEIVLSRFSVDGDRLGPDLVVSRP